MRVRGAVGFVVVLALVVPGVLLAQSGVDDAIRISRQGLNFNARALGMGNAYSTIGYDFTALRMNPATLGFSKGATYTMSVNTSAFAIVIDPESKEVAYGNAGHPFPYRLSTTGQLGALAGSGPLLGDEVDARYRITKVQVSAGDLLLLYTDGLVHALDPGGKPFGDRRLPR